MEAIPSTGPHSQSFQITPQDSDPWAELNLPLTETDWNSLSIDHATPYPTRLDGVDITVSDLEHGMMSTLVSHSVPSESNEPHALLAPSVVASSVNSQGMSMPMLIVNRLNAKLILADGHSHASPVSQIPGSVPTSLSSPATSQGDEALSRVESSRVEKRRLNTLAARRCRQRRVDRMKSLEAELESVRRERDELKLRVSKLEGETEALKTLLSRKGD